MSTSIIAEGVGFWGHTHGGVLENKWNTPLKHWLDTVKKKLTEVIFLDAGGAEFAQDVWVSVSSKGRGSFAVIRTCI